MTTALTQMTSTDEPPTRIGWGLSGLTPYFLLGQAEPVRCIINGRGAEPGATAFGLSVVGPDYLYGIDSRTNLIVAYPELNEFGNSIRQQLKHYGDFTLQQAQVWADAPSCTELQYQQALQHWLATLPVPDYQPLENEICLFITKLDKGGAERQIVLLARGLTKLGYHVTLICQSPDHASTQSWQQQLAEAGVARLWLNDARQLWQQNPPTQEELLWLSPLCRLLRPRGAHNVLALSRIYTQLKPKYVISYLDDCNIVSSIAAILSGVPQVTMSARSTEPNLLHPDGEPAFYICALAQMKNWYQALLDRFPEVILYANSQAGKTSYEAWLGRALSQTVGNAVDAPPSVLTTDIRQHHQLPQDCEILLGIMRFTAEKNPQAFIRVFARLRQKRPSLRAILLGDGPLRPELTALVHQHQVEDTLLMPGKVDDTTSYLLQANCLLCPSHTEGMPNVILEAQACGLPLVATNVGGIAEALARELHGFLVDVTDEAGMLTELNNQLQAYAEVKALFTKVQTTLLANRSLRQLAQQTLKRARQTGRSIQKNCDDSSSIQIQRG